MSCPVNKEQGECPVNRKEKINPNNNMPELSQSMAPLQTTELPTSRTPSSIKDKNKSFWQYPSPQQFFNALVRKGKPVPEENVEAMVQIHNFLNEGSWDEILKWEKKYHCECDDITLNAFMGKPDELSPKAWFYSTVYGSSKPFDRHDWIVDRCGKEQRYIIDYYGGEGDATFHVDVRPAIDSPSALFDRIRQGFSDIFK
jgi:cytochrome c heme-lyase